MANGTGQTSTLNLVVKTECTETSGIPDDDLADSQSDGGATALKARTAQYEARVTDEDKALLDKLESRHTKRNTMWAIQQWSTWRQQQNADNLFESNVPIISQLMQFPRHQIDELLAKFITDVRRLDGKEYPEPTIKGLAYALQRYSKAFAEFYNTSRPAVASLLSGDSHIKFPKFTKAYFNKIDVIRKSESVLSKPHASALTPVTEEQEMELWERGIFGCTSAETLSDTLFYYVVTIFGLVSRQSLACLKIDQFHFGVDEQGEYVEISKLIVDYNNVAIYIRPHGIEIPGEKLRHYRDPDNPRSFYNILQFYIKIVNPPTTPLEYCKLFLFQKPLKGYAFDQKILGQNILSNGIKRIMKKANIDGNFTNQSLIRSATMKLCAKGFNLEYKRKMFDSETRLKICRVLDPPCGHMVTTPEMNDTNLTEFPLHGTPSSTQLMSPNINTPANSCCDSNSEGTVLTGAFIDTSGNNSCSSDSKGVSDHSNHECDSQHDHMDSDVFMMKEDYADSMHKHESFVTDIGTCQANTNDSRAVSPAILVVKEEHLVCPDTIYGNNATAIQNNSNPEIEQSKVNANNTGPRDRYEDELNNAEGNRQVSPNILIVKEESLEYIVNICGDTSQTIQNSAHVEFEQSNVNTNNATTIRNKRCIEEVQNDVETKKVKSDVSDVDSKTQNIITLECRYKNDSKKNTVKQDVTITEDDQTVYTISETNKQGIVTNDLNVNLGDYIPDGHLISPSDISFQRINTADGVKMVVSMKYCNSNIEI